MAGNAIAQFTKNGFAPAVRVTAANVSSEGDGTVGTSNYLVVQADATNGSFIEFVRIMPRASLANTSTSATVIRLFTSTVASGATTSANTNLIYEYLLPSIVAASSTGAVPWYDVPLNIRLAAGMTILGSSHVAAAANTSWGLQAFGGDY